MVVFSRDQIEPSGDVGIDEAIESFGVDFDGGDRQRSQANARRYESKSFNTLWHGPRAVPSFSNK